MPKISEIVGGILRDLAQSHAAADAQTRQALESYRQDPVLSQFPVPRVVIQQASVKLRFVITGHGTGTSGGDDPKQYRDLWTESLRERVLPQFLLNVGKLDNKAVADAMRARLSKPGIEDRVEATSLSDASKLSAIKEQTAMVIVDEAESLPKSVRRYLPDKGALLAAAKQVVDHEMPEVQRAAEAIHKANQAARSDLEIAIRPDDLKSVPDAQINELQLTLSLEPVERGSKEQ